MKRLFILGILAFLAGCVGGAWVGKPNCSRGGEVCVTIEVAEPIRWGEPIIVTIKVTAKRDISDLRVSLNHWPGRDSGVVVEGPEGWEVEVREKKVAEFAASWKTDVKANKPSVFVCKVRLLAEMEVRLSAAVYRPDLGYISSGVSVLLTRKGGVVNPTPEVLPGTPELAVTMPPGWWLTPFPTATPWPTPPPTPTDPLPRRPVTPTPTPPVSPFLSPLSPLPAPTLAASP